MGYEVEEVIIRSGAISNRELVYFLAESTRLDSQASPHTLVISIGSDNLDYRQVNWIAHSCCITKTQAKQLIAIGEEETALVVTNGQIADEDIRFQESTGKTGPLSSVRDIAGKAYAVGMDSLVLRRDGPGVWVPMYEGLSLEPETSLEAIDGFGEKDLYAVGWGGAVWHYDGHRWSSIDSPTNVILTNVCCASDGLVYCCGQNGTLLRGRESTWTILPVDGTNSDLWDVKWFEGNLYVSTMMQLYRQNGNDFKTVDFGDDQPTTCYHLSSTDGALCSIGAKDALLFNGERWVRLLTCVNGE